MPPDDNKRLITRYLEILDSGDQAAVLDVVDECVAEDYVGHFAGATLQGRDGLKAHIADAYATFGNMQHVIEDNLAEGDKVVTRVRFCAVHRGEFLGISPTGRQVECPVIYITRFAAGRIQEVWLDWDSLFTIAQQLRGA